MQNDVIGRIDSDGKQGVNYSYDAGGELVNTMDTSGANIAQSKEITRRKLYESNMGKIWYRCRFDSVCIINYYVVSIWVNGKDEFHAYSLKTSIIFLIEVMLVLNMGKTDRSDRYQRRKYRKAQSIPLSCLLLR